MLALISTDSSDLIFSLMNPTSIYCILNQFPCQFTCSELQVVVVVVVVQLTCLPAVKVVPFFYYYYLHNCELMILLQDHQYNALYLCVTWVGWRILSLRRNFNYFTKLCGSKQEDDNTKRRRVVASLKAKFEEKKPYSKDNYYPMPMIQTNNSIPLSVSSIIVAMTVIMVWILYVFLDF